MEISVDQKRDLIGSVVRALRILDVVAAHPRGLTPKAISLKLDLHLSTCYHLLNTLAASGFLVRRLDTQTYVLGSKIAYLNSGFLQALEVLPVLRAHVQTLHDTTGETAYLGQWQDDVVISAIVEGMQPVRVQSLYVGYRGNAHAMALGKVLLAHLPLPQQARFFAQQALPACTPATITDAAMLQQELSDVRRTGYAVDVEEFAAELCCIAAPVVDCMGEAQAAIALSVPRSRYDRAADRFIAAVTDAAQRASAALGNNGHLSARERG